MLRAHFKAEDRAKLFGPLGEFCMRGGADGEHMPRMGSRPRGDGASGRTLGEEELVSKCEAIPIAVTAATVPTIRLGSVQLMVEMKFFRSSMALGRVRRGIREEKFGRFPAA